MPKIEIMLFWSAIFVYIVSFCFYLSGFFATKPKLTKCAHRFLWLALILHTSTAVIRWIAGSHPPVTDTYELNLTGTWFTVLVFLIFEKIRKADSAIAIMLIPVVFLILGHGFTLRTDTIPMGPAYKSLWLIVHVIFAWLSFGFYVISTGAAAFLLTREKLLSKRPSLKIPEPEILDIASYRFIVMGFINHAIMLVSGAIWAKKLWGHYWSWDPLETWSLISFLFYAFYLHSRSFLGWKMKRAAFLALLGLAVMIVSFWGVGWFSPSVHPGP